VEEEPQPIAAEIIPERCFVDLNKVPSAFDFVDGFSRPDWVVIREAIDKSVTGVDHPAAWGEVLLQWAQRLRQDLGGEYAVCQSSEFVLLSPLSREVAHRLLDFAEQAVSEIREHLRGLAWRNRVSKAVVLLFADLDDYYGYLSYFFTEGGSIPQSLGVYLHQGYPHIVMTHGSDIESAQTLTHELTHNCLGHLPIPLWLNEGVAMRLQRGIAGVYAPRAGEGELTHFWASAVNWQPPLMWHEMAAEHHTVWNGQSIQAFWAGTSFRAGDKTTALSYNLAEVLVHLLAENRDSFLEFLSRAHYDDAGQTAALDCLGTSLGDAVGTFLGPGDWRPVRKAIVECWEDRKRQPPSQREQELPMFPQHRLPAFHCLAEDVRMAP